MPLIIFLHFDAQAAFAERCGSSSKISGLELRVSGPNIVLLTSPNAKGEKIINQKATKVLKSTQYLTIDNSVTVIEECIQGEWSKISVKEPNWLRETHIGWVPSSSLRKPKITKKGENYFVDADFSWNNRTLPYKKIIITGVNKIHRENLKCGSIDPSSADISSTKGSSSDPVFYVTCGSGIEVFNEFFSKSDIEKGKKLSMSKK